MNGDALELEKSVLLTALGEEFQMVDTYSSVREICHNRKVIGVLDVLIRESNGHASAVSGMVLELASGYSLNLDEMDEKMVQLSAKSPQLKLTKEASEWYKGRISGIAEAEQEDIAEAHSLTQKATIQALEIFEGSERNAYTLYSALSGILESKEHKAIAARIASDEVRHESMLKGLVRFLKSGKAPDESEEKGKDGAPQASTMSMLYCTACLKIHRGDAESCSACGGTGLEGL